MMKFVTVVEYFVGNLHNKCHGSLPRPCSSTFEYLKSKYDKQDNRTVKKGGKTFTNGPFN